MDLPVWVFVAILLVTIAIPIVYVAVTWEHEVFCSYPMLPAPSDLGTREFRWRCYLSPLTRRGWRQSILHSPCPQITLQTRFALLSADFTQLTTSLGFQKLTLETVPFIFPQIAVSGLVLQLLGNSHFPASVRHVRIKALTICQLRPLDMRLPDDQYAMPADGNSEQEHLEEATIPGLHCLMVLKSKCFLESEIEFSIQTDLFDQEGTVWQSTTCIAVPFKQDTLLAPLSTSTATLDEELMARTYESPISDTFQCSRHHLEEFENVNVSDLTGATPSMNVVPLMWVMGRAMGMLQQQGRVPALPLLCSLVAGSTEADTAVPLQSHVICESAIHEDANGKQTTKLMVKHGSTEVVTGLLRTVGWVFDGTNAHEGADASANDDARLG